jgi:hypothetical protein
VAPNPEACWFCGSDLCYECWDEHGHCGHAEAEVVNEMARRVKQPGETESVDVVEDIEAAKQQILAAKPMPAWDTVICSEDWLKRYAEYISSLNHDPPMLNGMRVYVSKHMMIDVVMMSSDEVQAFLRKLGEEQA